MHYIRPSSNRFPRPAIRIASGDYFDDMNCNVLAARYQPRIDRAF